MTDNEFLVGRLLVGLSGAVILAALLAIGLTRPGPRRPGLAAGALPLALVLPVLATVCAAFELIRAFAALTDPQGGAPNIMDAIASAWLLLRFAWGGVAGLCLVGLLMGVIGLGETNAGQGSSIGRGLVLLLLPLLALLTAGLHARQFARGLRVAAAVTALDDDGPLGQRPYEAALAAEGLRPEGPGGIAEVSTFIAGSMNVGGGGGIVALVVLFGLATTGFILAWHVTLDGPLRLAISAAWAVALLSASLLALGFFDPLRFH